MLSPVCNKVVELLFGLVCIAGMLTLFCLVMYLAVNQSNDALVDRMFEKKRAWASKWIGRIAFGLAVAIGLMLGAGFLGLS